MNNWIKKELHIGEKIKSVIKKRPSKKDIENSDWTTCCSFPILKSELKENLYVCKTCSKHHRINCKERFDIFFGKDNYETLDSPIPIDNPLNWEDTKPYIDRLKTARKNTGQKSAVMIATGKIGGINITAAAINFQFIGGSVASAEGEAIIYGIQHAIDNKNPFIFFVCGGGQRMHESPIALAQMTRSTVAVSELKNNNLPYIVVFTDPTAGGITASFASLSDIAISEPGALIAFAGRRVIEATVNETLEDTFQKAEKVQECGFVDLIVERKDLNEKISTLLKILLKKNNIQSLESTDETKEDSSSISSIAS